MGENQHDLSMEMPTDPAKRWRWTRARREQKIPTSSSETDYVQQTETNDKS